MIIVMMPFFTIVFTQRVFHGVIAGRYRMNDPLIHKGLQGTVYRYPVKLFFCFEIYIMMCQRGSRLQEQGEDLRPAVRYTQPVPAQQC